MASEADFVIVGGGTAGCLLASRLANSRSHPSVILIEAGEDTAAPECRYSYNRFRLVFEHPELDHGYISKPLAAFGGRQVPQARGKGLGGSSQINFQVWSLGARDEFERWAELVGDEGWGFDAVLGHVKEIENLHFDDLEDGNALLAGLKPEPANHGYNGEVDVSVGPVYERELEHVFGAAKEHGASLNPDPNSGTPIGFGLAPTTGWQGKRTTSASAFLPDEKRPANLQIFTNSRATQVIFEGKTATAVQTIDGRQFTARKEIVLSAGSIDSPRLLLLSGVGPAADLERLGIPKVKSLAGVGQSFTDHAASFMTFEMHEGFSERHVFDEDATAVASAINQFGIDGNGPLSLHYSNVPTAFLKHDQIASWPSFSQLPEDVKDLLEKPAVPHFELALCGPLIPPNGLAGITGGEFFSVFVALQNPQARGHLTLASADANAPAAIHPNYLDNDFDRNNLTEAFRYALDFMNTPTMKKHRKQDIFAPQSSITEDIENFIRATVTSLWHPSGTLKMGPQDDANTVVDMDLKVHGFDNLRVADLSVTSLLPSGHPQIVAYAIGAIAAEKIIKQYVL